MKQKPNVKAYQSVSLYLQHYYEFRKQEDPLFSYTTWAQELGVKSRGYLRLIVMDERPINQKTLDSLLSSLKLDAQDAEYFATLVNYNQSKNKEQKKVFGKKILTYQMTNQNILEIEDHYEFLSHPILPRLQTLLGFQDLAEDPQQITKLLDISEKELALACTQLEKLSLIEPYYDSKNEKKWRAKKKSWRLANNYRNLAYREFYIESLKNAEKAIDAFEPDERRFRSLFFAMNQNEFQDFLRDFESFVQEQSAKRDPSRIDNRKLYQLNFNFFPNSNALDTSVETQVEQTADIKMNTVD